MKRAKRVSILIGVVLAVLVSQASGASSSDDKILEFDTLVGVSGPFVGAPNPIRGVSGGGLPWQIDEGKGELRADGSLEVEVEGLVLLDGAPVPPALRGTNPVPAFRAVVSCLTTVDGAPATRNVSTDTFPATTTGDAEIEAAVTLPSPCFVPIVFVTSPTGSWFAVTGL
ncbi:MAG: hypothetical protein ACRDHS_06670 [Actinomycetota bacterium]